MNVPVGLSTRSALLVTLLSFGAAVAAYLNGDHTTAYALVGLGGATHGVMAGGRYLQAATGKASVATPTAVAEPEETALPSDAQELAAPPPAAPATTG